MDEDTTHDNHVEDKKNETKLINDIEVVDHIELIHDEEDIIVDELVNQVNVDLEEESSDSINWALFNEDKLEESEEEFEEETNENIDVNEIEVIDYIELIPTEEKNEIGEVIHEMDYHLLFEPLSEI